MYKNECKKLINSLKNIDTSYLDELVYTLELDKLLIAGEDHRFVKHNGVDYIALCRAFWRTVFCGRREGASTITMQLVRVITNKYEKTLSRKFLEIYLATQITKNIPKDRIIILYLSVAYFGWNMDGIEQAIDRLKFKNITIKESAGLIARLKYPEPKNFSMKQKKLIDIRTEYILARYKKLKLGLNYGSI